MTHKQGSLTVVGTGIKVAGHTTLEAKAHMEQADKLLYLVADPATRHWILSLNPDAESLQPFYGEGKDRMETYMQMVDRILDCVREGGRVCAAFYGHPGVFVFPSHEVIHRAREKGFDAKMLPGISAEDCLFADLGVDPGTTGCQSFECTDFLAYRRKFDPAVGLVLWQIAVIGELGYRTDRLYNPVGLQLLSEHLAHFYGEDHQVVVYEASQYPICDPLIEVVSVRDLAVSAVSPIATLYVPPIASAHLDLEVCRRLGIEVPGASGNDVEQALSEA